MLLHFLTPNFEKAKDFDFEKDFSNTKNFLIVIPLLDTQNLDNALNLDTVRNLNIAIHQHINTKILLMNDLQFDNTRFHKVR